MWGSKTTWMTGIACQNGKFEAIIQFLKLPKAISFRNFFRNYEFLYFDVTRTIPMHQRPFWRTVQMFLNLYQYPRTAVPYISCGYWLYFILWMNRSQNILHNGHRLSITKWAVDHPAPSIPSLFHVASPLSSWHLRWMKLLMTLQCWFLLPMKCNLRLLLNTDTKWSPYLVGRKGEIQIRT